MMEAWKERTALLLGEENVRKLENCHVAVLGLGGVGGACAEALARAGVGEMTLFDPDTVSESNINRQLIALHSTAGMPKTQACAQRLLDINPHIHLHRETVFFSAENAESYPFSKYDYVVDAIDTVSGKIAIVEEAKKANVPVIAAMGAGNKLDPTKFEVADISKTSVCPLARVMRRELKKRGIEHLKVVYSKEEPLPSPVVDEESGKSVPGSVAFVPSVVGLILAGEVVKDLIK